MDEGDNSPFEYDNYVDFYGTGEANGSAESSNIIHMEEDDMLENLPKEIYCDIVETLEDKCGEFSLLEIWKYDRNVISNLTQQDIIKAINSMKESPVFGYKVSYIDYLGQVEFNSSGQVVRAKSVRSIWLEQFDPDKIPPSQELIGFEAYRVDPFTLEYEQEVLKVLDAWRTDRFNEDRGYSFYMNLGLSFDTESNRPLENDTVRQIIGYSLMFVYTLLSLGKLNVVENKFYLAGAGITSIILGITAGLGLTMLFGYIYTPLSGAVPFLCLAIGIDDMFVIMRCFNNIPEEEKKENGPIKNMGITMQHAGASITVTSLTDVCAMGTGALTTFPSLQSFCVTSAIAIVAIYLLQISWFVAFMVLDEYRIEQKRNGLVPFIVHENWQPPKWSNKDVGKVVMSKIAKIFSSKVFLGFIPLLTATSLLFGIWGAYEIRVEYDFVILVPDGSYLTSWLNQNAIAFPSDGPGVTIYTQDISYTVEDFEKIETIAMDMDNLTKTHNEWVHYGKELPKAVQTPWEVATGFWWPDLKKFIADHKAVKDWRQVLALGHLPMYLSDFLHHEDGAIYKNSFKFSGDLRCNMDAPPITAAKLGALKFRNLRGPAQHLPAQEAIENILAKANLSSNTFAYGYRYPQWEVEDILLGEMFRNLAIAFSCVLIIVLVILADLRACFFILGCIIFTLVDVVGLTYAMGMTLDPFSTICNVVGIGVCVDYGVHIAHSFIVAKGTKAERAIDGFITISPAIIHGGISTILAVLPIAFSESHSFITFFRLLTSTVCIGLFHGLLFLPVMLILFGTDKKNDDYVKGNIELRQISDAATTDELHEHQTRHDGIDNPDFKSKE